MTPTLINGKWTLLLTEHRANLPIWPEWEYERFESMRANLEPGMVIFDIGAEEGDMPAMWALWGCKVVLVEPNPRVWSNIRTVWDANKFTPHGWFVGFASDTDITPKSAEGWQNAVNGWPRCAWHDVITDHGFCNTFERPEIPQATIDTLSKRFGAPDAITMDIEGAELLALHGAPETLKTARPLLWISVHRHFMADKYRHPVTALFKYLRSFGYATRILSLDHEAHVFAWPSERTVELPTP